MTEPMFRGELDFLSNFHRESFFTPDFEWVPSAEHAFMAYKTVDPEEQEYILAAPTPGEAKKRGRTVTLRPGWDTGFRVEAMSRVLNAKFSTTSLWERLWHTGDLYLAETNDWHDNFWGVCYCTACDLRFGHNMLGELLMQIRARGNF